MIDYKFIKKDLTCSNCKKSYTVKEMENYCMDCIDKDIQEKYPSAIKPPKRSKWQFIKEVSIFVLVHLTLYYLVLRYSGSREASCYLLGFVAFPFIGNISYFFTLYY